MHNQFEFLFIYFTRFSFAIRGAGCLYLIFPYCFLFHLLFFFFCDFALWAPRFTLHFSAAVVPFSSLCWQHIK